MSFKITEDEFERLIAFRDRVMVEAVTDKPSPNELYNIYIDMERLLREVRERQEQESCVQTNSD